MGTALLHCIQQYSNIAAFLQELTCFFLFSFLFFFQIQLVKSVIQAYVTCSVLSILDRFDSCMSIDSIISLVNEHQHRLPREAAESLSLEILRI